MKRLLLTAVALLCALARPASAQTMTVTGSHLQDASGNLCAWCTITFAPVDLSGHPLSFRLGSANGQVLSRPVSAAVNNGAFSIVLPDTSQTNPAHACFSVTVVDLQTGASVLGPGYGCVQPDSTLGGWCNSASCNFDAYVPNNAAIPVTTISGGGSGNTGALITLADTSASGTYWAISSANGSLQIASTTNGLGAVSSFTFTDSVNGTHTLSVTNGSIQVN